MATDKLFFEYATHFPNAVAKFIQVKADDYEVKSLTFKTEKRSDIFLIGRSGKHVALLETQGYPKDDLFYEMVQKLMFYCIQQNYRGDIEAVAIFLEESQYRAAQSFDRQFENSNVLRFTPKVIVLRGMPFENLHELNDIYLTPLYPLCNISPEEIQRQAHIWADEIKNAPGLYEEKRKNLLAFLGGAISHRIKNITIDALNELFGGFAMEDTPLGKELLQIGEQRGIERGIPIGIQQILLKQIAARFGTVPADLQQKILTLDKTENLERIATMLLTIQNIDELKDLVN